MAMENGPFEDVSPIENGIFHCYVRLPECNTHKHNGKLLIVNQPENPETQWRLPLMCLLGQLPPEDLGLLVFLGPPANWAGRDHPKTGFVSGWWNSMSISKRTYGMKKLIYINTLFLYLKIMPKPYKHSVYGCSPTRSQGKMKMKALW